MHIDFNRTVAYMCPGCGETTFADFSLFEFSGGRGISIKCDCGKSYLKIYPKTKTQFIISQRCLICDVEHEFAVTLDELMKRKCIDFVCPEILIGLSCIGKKEEVNAYVKENENYIRGIVSACGLEHTGRNGITMLKALDKIQELSDEGCLSCECGSNLIDVDVLEDELILECCKCGAEISFTADEIRNESFSGICEITVSKDTKKSKDKNN